MRGNYRLILFNEFWVVSITVILWGDNVLSLASRHF